MSKVVLITGGSRGIGRAAALLAAARGLVGRRQLRADVHAADEVVEAIAKSRRPRGRAAGATSRSRRDVSGCSRPRPARSGRSTAVVVNAGVVAPTAQARRHERRADAARVRGQRARRLSHRPRGRAADVEEPGRRRRLDRADLFGRVPARLAQPLRRLRRLEGRDRYADPRPLEGTRRPRACGSTRSVPV